jgi:hypothetical protein
MAIEAVLESGGGPMSSVLILVGLSLLIGFALRKFSWPVIAHRVVAFALFCAVVLQDPRVRRFFGNCDHRRLLDD